MRDSINFAGDIIKISVGTGQITIVKGNQRFGMFPREGLITSKILQFYIVL